MPERILTYFLAASVRAVLLRGSEWRRNQSRSFVYLLSWSHGRRNSRSFISLSCRSSAGIAIATRHASNISRVSGISSSLIPSSAHNASDVAVRHLFNSEALQAIYSRSVSVYLIGVLLTNRVLFMHSGSFDFNIGIHNSNNQQPIGR